MTILEAIEQILSEEGRALNAKELAHKLGQSGRAQISGKTPWKTVGARLAEDIRENSRSTFLRLGPGLYGLRCWEGVTEFQVKHRKINPLDEYILAVRKKRFAKIVGAKTKLDFYPTNYREVLQASEVVYRRDAEKTEDFVQLIPSFVIFMGSKVLSFNRTKKSPEQRLHDRHSIVFGGHLQSEDDPGLFADEPDHAKNFLFRELHEELSFDKPILRSQYVGVLYLQGSPFERQHAGIVFAVEVPEGARPTSEEPGYHNALKFLEWDEIWDSPVISDRWSAACIARIESGG